MNKSPNKFYIIIQLLKNNWKSFIILFLVFIIVSTALKLGFYCLIDNNHYNYLWYKFRILLSLYPLIILFGSLITLKVINFNNVSTKYSLFNNCILHITIPKFLILCTFHYIHITFIFPNIWVPILIPILQLILNLDFKFDFNELKSLFLKWHKYHYNVTDYNSKNRTHSKHFNFKRTVVPPYSGLSQDKNLVLNNNKIYSK
jgi:hypothetical protein